MLRQDFHAAKDWCYTGVGVLEWDAKMRDYLKNNNWRYPIVAREGTDERAMDMHVHEVVTLRDMLLSFEDPAAVVRLLAAPSTKIVSLTITEYGYRVPLNEGDHKLLELANQGVLEDPSLSMPESLDASCAKATVFGLILSALAMRHRLGRRPFTVMSCDNLPHNGDVAKKRVINAARDAPEIDESLCQWLEDEVKYPSTMVDRITPATSPQDISDLKEKAGIDDQWPVMCEPYKHWVIEDDFVDGARPAWERVGALLVPDVRPHELMKVRLLNVTHSALCYVGSLAGLTNVHEAVTHKMIKPYLRRLMNEEIAASLRADPTMPEELLAVLDEYTELVLSRFENVAVKDTLDRVAMDGSEKFRVQGREVIMERLAREGSVRGFALYVASWAHFLRRSVRDGEKIRDASAGLIAAPWDDGQGKHRRRHARPWRRSSTSKKSSASSPGTRDGARLSSGSLRTSTPPGWKLRSSAPSSASGTTATRICRAWGWSAHGSARAGRSRWTRPAWWIRTRRRSGARTTRRRCSSRSRRDVSSVKCAGEA